jgi:hypothetical protein
MVIDLCRFDKLDIQASIKSLDCLLSSKCRERAQREWNRRVGERGQVTGRAGTSPIHSQSRFAGGSNSDREANED